MLNPRTKNALYVLIFTAIAVLGAYFLITEINKMSQDSNESILSDFWQKKKPNQAEVTDIKDWKTYRNEEYGVEFMYPNYLKHKTSFRFRPNPKSNEVILENTEKEFYPSTGFLADGAIPGVNIESEGFRVIFRMFVDKNNLTLIDWLKKEHPEVEGKNIIKNELAGKESFYFFTDEAGAYHGHVVKNDDNIFEFTLQSHCPEECKSEQVFDQILSTFKFIETDLNMVYGNSPVTLLGILDEKGGTLTNGLLTFTLSPGVLLKPVNIELKSYPLSKLLEIPPGMAQEDLNAISGNIEIKFLGDETSDPVALENYESKVTLFLQKQWPPGKKLKVLVPNSTTSNWAITDFEAIVDAEGKSASFITDDLDLYILISEEDLLKLSY